MPALESQLLSRQPHVPGKVTLPPFALIFPLKLGITMTTPTTKTHLTVVIVNSRKAYDLPGTERHEVRTRHHFQD